MTTIDTKERAKLARAWWAGLQPVDTDKVKLPGNRAALARLRRCSSPPEAAAEPETAALFRKLEAHPNDIGRVAALASVLAHVRDEPKQSPRIARAIGSPPGGEPEEAIVKPVRFKTLMSARTDEEVLIAFRRVVALLDRKANVTNLAELVLGWTDDDHGDRVRTRFAFDYHGAGFAAPSTDSEKVANDTTAQED